MSDQLADCPADLMAAAAEVIKSNEIEGLSKVESLLRGFPSDARLHFLRGSLLASLTRYGEAHEAMAKAVQIAPQFAVARFQLGFLELTSGDAVSAEATWAPLQSLSPQDPLRMFARGLHCLIKEDFVGTIETLNQGIAHNTENPAINADMRLLIEKSVDALASQNSISEPISAAHLLLKQYTSKSTKH